MSVTHEAGHLFGGWLSGAKLQQSSLVPWAIPYSLHEPDPYPLWTLWAGPVLGVLIPASIAMLIQRSWMYFVAHFCTLANGTYLAISWLTGDRYTDTQRLLEADASPWSVAVYCLAMISVGYVYFRRACIRELTSGGPNELAQDR